MHITSEQTYILAYVLLYTVFTLSYFDWQETAMPPKRPLKKITPLRRHSGSYGRFCRPPPPIDLPMPAPLGQTLNIVIADGVVSEISVVTDKLL
jgi:hypothetical protein